MLHYRTVSDELKKYLLLLMKSDVFSDFRLVGGTALSLQLGHRISIDIDLFTDCEFGSMDFALIDSYLETNFKYVNHEKNLPTGFGKSYLIGENRGEMVKIDVFYTDAFIQSLMISDGVRMATIEEIAAMKLDVVERGGRKKDFWDIHELLNHLTLGEMIALYEMRHPYTYDREVLLEKFTDFSFADEDLDPTCLKGKYWQFVKEDIIQSVYQYQSK